MDEQLDSSWYNISRVRPETTDIDTLLTLLQHDDWKVRWNAARELRFQPDARALDLLLKRFKREKHVTVRHMLVRALGALHESGIEVPLFADLKDPSEETRRNLAIKRLRELKVQVSTDNDRYILLNIPHKLEAECFIEVGFLLAQLAPIVFPEDYSPISDSVPSAVLPYWRNSSIEYPDNFPTTMKFRVYYRNPTDEFC